MESRFIRVSGARVHNLRNVSVEIPRDRLVVFTGLSGSGKSSLAFDTIFAEGQRKYVESLSVHARMFLEQLTKPDVERIEGLPPTIAIEQRVAASNPRSTVATTTEIHDFLRLLYARVGEPHCPKCGRRIWRQTVDQMVDAVLAWPAGARLMVLSPMARGARGDLGPVLKRIVREGFVRARINGEIVDVKDFSPPAGAKQTNIDVVIDRLVNRADIRHRLADAIELSLSLAEGLVIVSREENSPPGAPDRMRGERQTVGTAHPTHSTLPQPLPSGEGGFGERWVDFTFSDRHTCVHCGITLPDLSPRAFSFNSPYGACPACDGLGTTTRFHPELVVADAGERLNGRAIGPWSDHKGRFDPAFSGPLGEFCTLMKISPETAFEKLDDDARRILLHGTRAADERALGAAFVGVIPALERRWNALGGTSKGGPSAGGGAMGEGVGGGDVAGGKPIGGEAPRSHLALYQSELPCETCGGARIRPEPLAVRIAGKNIREVTALSIEKAAEFAHALRFEGEAATIADAILHEMRQRLRFMVQLGIGYLTLDRASATLSGGEAQRIRLATQIGSGLVGVCYVLDEPTIGLHQRDTERLLASMRRLVDIGNSVLVVEHDEDVIRAADYVIEIGPGAGQRGGQIVAQGPAAEALANPASLTGKYIRGEYEIELPEQRRKVLRSNFLEIRGARQNNLKNIDVKIPLGVFCGITGVSGSGKSTLVSQILLPALRRRLGGLARNGDDDRGRAREAPGLHDRVIGANKIDRVIEIDQTPIGRTPRSNPATYTGVFDEIRKLYAATKEAKIRGYNAGRFTFNAKGGRCEACQGQGVRRIEMQFLPDVFVECQQCRGTRYNRETLEVRYRGKSIADVLDMRIEDAISFFENFAKIKQGLRALSDVGLGYMRLGQSSNTLSGGEAQRVKLAAELGGPSGGHTLYVLDEPTTGLHFADIHTLLAVLDRLVEKKNTVLVIEHNLDVIKTADWIIDLGPEGGDAGGRIVAEGTPEEVAARAGSHTGKYLSRKLHRS